MDTNALYPSMREETPAARPADLPANQLHYAKSDLSDKPPEINQERPPGTLSYPSLETEEKKPDPPKEAAKEVKSPPLPSEKPVKQEGPLANVELDEDDKLYVKSIELDHPSGWANVGNWLEGDLREIGEIAGANLEDIQADLAVANYLKQKILNDQTPPAWRKFWSQIAFSFRMMKKDIAKNKKRGA
jgi:hypothetical protein